MHHLPSVADDSAESPIDVQGGEEGVQDTSKGGGGVGWFGHLAALQLFHCIHLCDVMHWVGWQQDLVLNNYVNSSSIICTLYTACINSSRKLLLE